MKKEWILKDAKGFVEANMKDGMIFAKKRSKTSPPVEEIAQEDAKLLMKYLDIGHAEVWACEDER